MTTAAVRPKPPGLRWRLIAALLTIVLGAIVIGANIHLVWAAVGSQPECVPHAKTAGGGSFRAAKSAC